MLAKNQKSGNQKLKYAELQKPGVHVADYIKRLDMEQTELNSKYKPMTDGEMETLQRELHEFWDVTIKKWTEE